MESWPKITFFGDSQTRRSMDPNNGCWIAHIAHKVAHYFQVDIRGFDGYTSRWGLELMPKLFPKSYLEKVEIFVLWLGHNDAWEPMGSLPVVGVEEYESNMRAILKHLEDNGVDSSKIILITPTWYHKESWEKSFGAMGFPALNKSFEHQLKYSEVNKRLAKEKNIDLLDFMTISSQHEPLDELFCDGGHLSKIGSQLLFDSLMPIIDKKIETKFGKPIDKLWHVVPAHEHPQIKPVLEKYMEKLKIKEEQETKATSKS